MPLTATPWQPCPAPAPEGRAVFAIGDVHGCADELARLHDTIRGEIDALGLPATVVWEGDYIDRGPDSRRALELVADGLDIPGVDEVRLLGNHDGLLLDLLDPTQPVDHPFDTWICNGGYQAIQSFGLTDFPSDPMSFRQALSEALGWKLRSLLSSLVPCHRMGGLFFAHAGIDPARPLDGQEPKVLTRIRDRFLSWTEPFPERVCVVHGHSIDTPGVFNGNRIAVDSGCFETGGLTAAEIVGDRVRFLMTAG